METFGTDDIQRAVGHVSFLRGLDYFERGMVRSVEFVSRGRIHGEVSGSRQKPYAVVAKYEPGSEGGFLPVEGHCSCPVGYNCKHTAAVLLAACHLSPDGDDSGSGTARGGVSGVVRRWLDRWPKAAAGKEDDRPGGPDAAAGPPALGREHLFYVIHSDETRHVHIAPYRAYLRKDGTIGTNFREYRERTPSRTHKYLTAEDAAILGWLDFYAGGGYPRRHDWPDGEELIGLIRGIVETGRARADDIQGAALSWADPRRCELGWSVGEAGEQQIVARDGAGSPLTLLAFQTPFFIDPESGEMGVAETALTARLASWFAAAPPVPHGSIHAVAAKLSRIGQHAPVPRIHRVEERGDVRPVPVLTLYGCTYKLPRYVHGDWRGTGYSGSVVYPFARLEIAYEGAATRLRAGRGDDIAASGDNGFAVIRRDRAREAAFEEALREAAKRYGYEDHELLRYDHDLPRELREANIVFPPVGDDEDDAAGGAGIGFVSQAVPQLRAEGWRVEIDGTWPFRLYEGPVAYSTSLEPRGSDWFSLCLSLEANGRKLDIAPNHRPTRRDPAGGRMGRAAGRLRRRESSGRQGFSQPVRGRNVACDRLGAVRAVRRGLSGSAGAARFPPCRSGQAVRAGRGAGGLRRAVDRGTGDSRSRRPSPVSRRGPGSAGPGRVARNIAPLPALRLRMAEGALRQRLWRRAGRRHGSWQDRADARPAGPPASGGEGRPAEPAGGADELGQQLAARGRAPSCRT